MRFPRAVRLDGSDQQVYDQLAIPGEWAVPGAFAFLDSDVAAMSGKQREAFRHGFLGSTSFGWSTLVVIDEISEPEYQAVIDSLADRFVQRYGAPNRDVALAAAREEAEFAASICSHDLDTLLALERHLEDDGIVESFRVVRPPTAVDHSVVRLWSFEEG